MGWGRSLPREGLATLGFLTAARTTLHLRDELWVPVGLSWHSIHRPWPGPSVGLGSNRHSHTAFRFQPVPSTAGTSLSTWGLTHSDLVTPLPLRWLHWLGNCAMWLHLLPHNLPSSTWEPLARHQHAACPALPNTPYMLRFVQGSAGC